MSTAPSSTHRGNMLSSARLRPLSFPRTTSGRHSLAQDATTTPPFMTAPQLRCANVALLPHFPRKQFPHLTLTLFYILLILPLSLTVPFPTKTATVTAVASNCSSFAHSLVRSIFLALFSSPSSLHSFSNFPTHRPSPGAGTCVVQYYSLYSTLIPSNLSCPANSFFRDPLSHRIILQGPDLLPCDTPAISGLSSSATRPIESAPLRSPSPRLSINK